MGLGPPVLELYRQLKILGALDGVRNVIELGSQDFWCPHQNLVRSLFAAFGRLEPPPELLLTTNVSQLPARQLYEELGFNYSCVDVDGRAGSIALDLNFDGAPPEHVGRYDLVTNHGTSEHVLNQYNVFKAMHDFAKPGGLMVHAVPFTVHLNHGFFNYQPNFFESLARYNSYEILGLWVGPDWQLPSFVPWHPALLDFLTLSSKTTHLLVVVLRKKYPLDFCTPFQEEYEPTVPDSSLSRYAVTIDGETMSGARIKYLTKSDQLAKEYRGEIQVLKTAIHSCGRQIDVLQQEFADGSHPVAGEQSLKQVADQLEQIKSQLTASLNGGTRPPPQQYSYEERAQITSVIPYDADQATRDHGVSILRVSPIRGGALTWLRIRALINCYSSEPNAAVVAIFQDGFDRPVALLAEPLQPRQLTLMDREVLASFGGGLVARALEVRIGLSHEGGTLWLNHDPIQNRDAAIPSCVQFSWSIGETEKFPGQSSLTTLLAEKGAALQAMRSLLAEKEAALQAIRNSRSWRITAPLRIIRNWLSRRST